MEDGVEGEETQRKVAEKEQQNRTCLGRVVRLPEILKNLTCHILEVISKNILFNRERKEVVY